MAAQSKANLPATLRLCELELAGGLEAVVWEELQRKLGNEATLLRPLAEQRESGALQVRYGGELARLNGLHTISAAYLVCPFAVPRPRALLGDQHYRQLLQAINLVLHLSPAGLFHTLSLSAAGADSTVMRRLREQLTAQLGMDAAGEEGDLYVRIRPARLVANGWEALIRLSPRPLSLRAWHQCHLPGGVNPAVAHCMVLLTRPNPADHFLNLACGSATLLVERLTYGPAAQIIGCDIDPTALRCAQSNLTASRWPNAVQLHPWDVRKLPLSPASINTFCSALPFGIKVGSHAENVALYPALLQEAGRVARPGGRAVLLTQEVRLLEEAIHTNSQWQLESSLRISTRGLRPGLYVLRRKPAATTDV
jgi:SAM-dependent methyltransferase